MTFQDALTIVVDGLAFSLAVGLIFVLAIQLRRDAFNRWLIALLATLAVWAGGALAQAVPDLSPLSRTHTLYLRFAALSLMPVFFLLATAALAKPEARWEDALVPWARVAVPVLAILPWTGMAVANPASGTGYALRALGYVAVLHATGCGLAVLLQLRLKDAQSPAAPFQFPAALLAAASLANLIGPLRAFPLDTGLAALTGALIGYTVLRRRWIEPLESARTQVAALTSELRLALGDLAAEKNRAARLDDDLRAATRYKSEFLANMSHELRTPLHSIMGYSELLLQGIYGPLGETQTDRLQKIHRNGLSLLSLLNDILDLSRIEGGRLELNLDNIRLTTLLDELHTAMGPQVSAKNLAFKSEIEHPLRLICADALRIRQVLLDLLENALHMTTQGYIRLSAQNITVKDGQSAEFPLPVQGWLEDRAWVLVSVTDTGPGIAPEDQARLFEEFHQPGGAATAQEGGGLGLVIAKKLVELHTGRIWVRSQPGAGCTFFVALPALDIFEEVETAAGIPAANPSQATPQP